MLIINNSRKNNNVPRRVIGAWWIAFGAIAICVYALITAKPDYLEKGAYGMVFQLVCWSVALVILSWKQPTGQLRLSDPGVLVLLWGVIYLIYPSILFFQGSYILSDARFPKEMIFLVFWLHGLFFLGFTFSYLIFSGYSIGAVAKINTKNLPSGWVLFTLSLFPLFVNILTRIISGGGLLLGITYGQVTKSTYSSYLITRSAGGFSYLWYQIYSKATFYIVLMQGIGAGLILIQTIKKRKGRLRNYTFLALVIIVALFSGTGRRTEVFLTVLISVIFLDIIIGPLPWRKLIPVALMGILFFIFFGYFRNIRYLSLSSALQEAYQSFLAENLNKSLGEYTLMFTKELYAVSIFRTAGSEGIPYLIQSILFIVPSQLNPSKLTFFPTNAILTIAIIGKAAYEQGIGTAGTMIGDGYRFLGTIGVFFWSIFLGSAFGLTKRWLFLEVRQCGHGLVLLKVALLAGLYGWIYNVIRTDLSEMIYIFFYDLFVPWFVLSKILPLMRQNFWLKVLPRKQST